MQHATRKPTRNKSKTPRPTRLKTPTRIAAPSPRLLAFAGCSPCRQIVKSPPPSESHRPTPDFATFDPQAEARAFQELCERELETSQDKDIQRHLEAIRPFVERSISSMSRGSTANLLKNVTSLCDLTELSSRFLCTENSPERSGRGGQTLRGEEQEAIQLKMEQECSPIKQNQQPLDEICLSTPREPETSTSSQKVSQVSTPQSITQKKIRLPTEESDDLLLAGRNSKLLNESLLNCSITEKSSGDVTARLKDEIAKVTLQLNKLAEERKQRRKPDPTRLALSQNTASLKGFNQSLLNPVLTSRNHKSPNISRNSSITRINSSRQPKREPSFIIIKQQPGKASVPATPPKKEKQSPLKNKPPESPRKNQIRNSERNAQKKQPERRAEGQGTSQPPKQKITKSSLETLNKSCQETRVQKVEDMLSRSALLTRYAPTSTRPELTTPRLSQAGAGGGSRKKKPAPFEIHDFPPPKPVLVKSARPLLQEEAAVETLIVKEKLISSASKVEVEREMQSEREEQQQKQQQELQQEERAAERSTQLTFGHFSNNTIPEQSADGESYVSSTQPSAMPRRVFEEAARIIQRAYRKYRMLKRAKVLAKKRSLVENLRKSKPRPGVLEKGLLSRAQVVQESSAERQKKRVKRHVFKAEVKKEEDRHHKRMMLKLERCEVEEAEPAVGAGGGPARGLRERQELIRSSLVKSCAASLYATQLMMWRNMMQHYEAK